LALQQLKRRWVTFVQVQGYEMHKWGLKFLGPVQVLSGGHALALEKVSQISSDESILSFTFIIIIIFFK
jgi:hypothetical protein